MSDEQPTCPKCGGICLPGEDVPIIGAAGMVASLVTILRCTLCGLRHGVPWKRTIASRPAHIPFEPKATNGNE